MCRWPLRAPSPLQSFLWPIVDPILVTLGQICNFCDPNLVTLYLCIYLINPLNRSSKNELTHFFNKLNEEHFTFHPQYKYPDRFANRKYEQLSYPENVRPHSSNSFENATPLIVNLVVKMRPDPAAHPHYPLYKEVPPPPTGGRPKTIISFEQIILL